MSLKVIILTRTRTKRSTETVELKKLNKKVLIILIIILIGICLTIAGVIISALVAYTTIDQIWNIFPIMYTSLPLMSIL